jgi:hypothetical protein
MAEPPPDDDDLLSEGDIAWLAGKLLDREEEPDGARLLLLEVGRRLAAHEPISGTRLAEYLIWAIKRFETTDDANYAFGLTRAEHRPTNNAKRDRMIAFMMERERARAGSIQAAAPRVRDYLLQCTPPIVLKLGTIKNIYQAHKDNSIVKNANYRR